MKEIFCRYENLAWIEFNNLSLYKNELLHFSTLRFGGVSTSPQASLNLGFTKSDLPENVLKNRAKFAKAIGLSLDHFVFSSQIHSSNIFFLTKEHKGRGAYSKETAIEKNDGYVLTVPDICACVLTADCTPVFFYEPVKKISSIVHSGWRGTVNKISAKAVETMLELGCSSKKILVGIGPSIKPCCYEVKEDVLFEFNISFGSSFYNFFNKSGTSYKLDMDKAIIHQLKEKGICNENIEVCNLCTHCNPFLFFSARNSNKGLTGRMASGIMLKKN